MQRYLTIILWIAAALIGSAFSQVSSDPTETLASCTNKIKFYLYTKTHPESYFIDLRNVEESTGNSTLDFTKQTKFISYPHELQRTDLNFTEIVQKMVNKLDANVIVIEWPLLFKRAASMKEIQSSRLFFEGLCIGRLLKRVGSMPNADPTKFHLIAVGEKVPVFVLAAKLSFPFAVGRLTGFEPVYDNISITFVELNTTRELGMNFVDMIYTSLSPSENIIDFGHVSFFPNGGTHPQPGVPQASRDVSVIRGLRYYVESIDKPDAFVAKKCESWAKYIAKECSGNESNKLGEYTSTNARGHFYLVTGERPPYSLV